MKDIKTLQADIDAIRRIPIIDTLLEVICLTTGMGFAVIARVTDDKWVACAVRDNINFGLGPGGELKIETTLCHEVHQNNCEVAIDNVVLDKVYANHHTPAMYGLQSYISMPITKRNGDFFGTLCAIDPRPAEVNNPKILGMFKLYADLISFHLAADDQLTLAETTLAEERGAVEELKQLSKTLVSLNNQLISSNKEHKLINIKLEETRHQLEKANTGLKTANEELVLSQLSLQENEEKFRLIADNISQLAWMADATGAIYWYNKRWYDYTGFNPDEMMGWGWQKVHHPEYVNQVTEKFKAHIASGLIWEDTFPLKGTDGQYRWFLSRAQPSRNDYGEIIKWFGTNTDVTEQVNTNKELELLKDRVSLALESARLGVWTAEMVNDKLNISDRACEIHGITPGTGITLAEAVNMILEPYRQVVSNKIAHAVQSGERFEVEYPIQPLDGSPVRWLKSNGSPHFDEQGKPLRITGTIIDITEQKKDEQRKNDFIGMVSHEMKTPLTSLKGYIQVLQGRTKKFEDEFVSGALDKANNQIGKMTKMINGFLNVSRFESGKIHIEHERFDMKDLVREIEEETVPVNTSHNIVFDPVLTTWVNGDRDKIGQVITNFISNALKYSAPGTTVQIACMAIDGCSQVSVRDEGMGIAPKDIDKLFDRYYRVEGHQMKSISGFGIGLYLSSEIIERHNGKIWVESEAGRGSTFYFSIPVADVSK